MQKSLPLPIKSIAQKLWGVQLVQCMDQSVRLIGSKGTRWSGNVVYQIWNCGNDDGFSQAGTRKLWLTDLVCTVRASKWQMPYQMGQKAMVNGPSPLTRIFSTAVVEAKAGIPSATWENERNEKEYFNFWKASWLWQHWRLKKHSACCMNHEN